MEDITERLAREESAKIAQDAADEIVAEHWVHRDDSEAIEHLIQKHLEPRLLQQYRQDKKKSSAQIKRAITGEGDPKKFLSVSEMLIAKIRKERDAFQEVLKQIVKAPNHLVCTRYRKMAERALKGDE